MIDFIVLYMLIGFILFLMYRSSKKDEKIDIRFYFFWFLLWPWPIAAAIVQITTGQFPSWKPDI